MNQTTGLRYIYILETQRIKNCISEAQQIITAVGGKQNNEDSIVIFWGYSGAGKSTAITILSGRGVKGHNQDNFPVIIQE